MPPPRNSSPSCLGCQYELDGRIGPVGVCPECGRGYDLNDFTSYLPPQGQPPSTIRQKAVAVAIIAAGVGGPLYLLGGALAVWALPVVLGAGASLSGRFLGVLGALVILLVACAAIGMGMGLSAGEATQVVVFGLGFSLLPYGLGAQVSTVAERFVLRRWPRAPRE
ncbi:MAG: hypothetical protein ACOYN0_01920 [Phycisphaerales bacterium]